MTRQLLLLILLLVPALSQAVNLDTADAKDDGTSATTHTYTSFTVTAHTNGLLLVGASVNSDTAGENTGCTWGGVALTALDNQRSASSTFSSTYVWYKRAPAAATANIVCSTNNATRMRMTTVSLYDVDQTTTFRDTDKNATASSHTSSLTLTSVSGDWLIEFIDVRVASGAATMLET